MGSDTPATAEGDLGRTPFAHLLVYAVDRRLTGTLFLSQPRGDDRGPVEHAVRFGRGVPVKVRAGDGFARLGELLVDAGALTPATLAEALATKGLLGDVLLLAGCVDRARLEETCTAQFRLRMTRLFALPRETTFRYCDGDDALIDCGGEPAGADPLALLWAGLEAHGGAKEIVDATLARLGDATLRLHPQATLARLGLGEGEARVVDHLLSCPEGIRALEARDLLPIDRLHQLLYALTITRQIETGSSAPPVGALDLPRSTTVARVQLRPTAHRLGAAAPDASGDGERGSTKPPSAPRKPILTPRATKPVEMLPPIANPRKASAEDRETLKSADSGRAADPERHVSVEVIDLAPTPAPTKPPPSALTDTVTSADAAEAPASAPRSSTRGLSANELFELAGARLVERDLAGAERACSRARQIDPDNLDCVALAAWIQAQRPGADVKGLTVELDELLGSAPDHRSARYYRAMFRKRLGDDAGAIRDLRRLLQQTPDDADALKALDALEGPPEKPRSSVLGWLFKR